MTSILSPKNVNSANVSNATVSSAKTLGLAALALSSNRKRKRAPAHLSRINLNLAARLSGSNESLNSGISSGSGSDDDGILTPPLSLGSEQPLFISSSSTEDYDKRSRLCTQLSSNLSSTMSSSVISNSLSSVKVTNTNKPILNANSVSTVGSNNISLNGVVDDCYDLAELECSQSGSGSTSTKSIHQFPASGGLVIGNGEFELVGDGRECKAVSVRTQIVYHCLVLKPDEYKNFLNVMSRLKFGEKFYDRDECAYLKNFLIPDEARSILGDNGIWYILLPDHHGNLHSLIQTRFNDFSLLGTQDSAKLFSERKIQPIFKQIVALVNFCHKIGIYFRDFRLRKFVFIDRERSLIRLNNVLDLWVAPDINSDRMTQRHVCPAYVAPEILDIRANVYAGQPADVWALGVLMFILLTGRYPFYEANPNPMALFKRIKMRRFSFQVNEYISPNARWLLHGILRLNPAERPTAAEILQSHWLQMEPDFLPDGLSLSEQHSNSTSTNTNIGFSSNSNLIYSLALPHSSLTASESFFDYFS